MYRGIFQVLQMTQSFPNAKSAKPDDKPLTNNFLYHSLFLFIDFGGIIFLGRSTWVCFCHMTSDCDLCFNFQSRNQYFFKIIGWYFSYDLNVAKYIYTLHYKNNSVIEHSSIMCSINICMYVGEGMTMLLQHQPILFCF